MKKISLIFLILISALLVSAPVFAEGTPNIGANAHIQNIGWVGYDSDENHNIVLGTLGQGKRMEAIELTTDYPGMNIVYNTHIQDIGWQGDRVNGQTSGTEGQAKQIEAISIRLEGAGSDLYDVYYRTHVQDYGWLGWGMNGTQVGTTNHFFRCEALQILIAPKTTPHVELNFVTPLIHATTRTEARHIFLVNQFRASRGLNYVSGNDALKRVCDLRVRELPVRMSHTRPNGSHYETIVKDAFPNYPYLGGGFIESYVEGKISYSQPEAAYNCYTAYPHMMNILLDPSIRWLSWSGIIDGTMGYSLEVVSGLEHIDFNDY